MITSYIWDIYLQCLSTVFFFYALPSVRVVVSLRSYACPPAKEPLHRPTQTVVSDSEQMRQRMEKEWEG